MSVCLHFIFPPKKRIPKAQGGMMRRRSLHRWQEEPSPCLLQPIRRLRLRACPRSSLQTRCRSRRIRRGQPGTLPFRLARLQHLAHRLLHRQGLLRPGIKLNTLQIGLHAEDYTKNDLSCVADLARGAPRLLCTRMWILSIATIPHIRLHMCRQIDLRLRHVGPRCGPTARPRGRSGWRAQIARPASRRLPCARPA